MTELPSSARMAVVIAIIALALILVPQTYRTMNLLGRVSEAVLSPDTVLYYLYLIRKPQAGEEVLPPPVRTMISLLRTHKIGSFRYSGAIAENEEIRQRLLEGSMPVRYQPASPYIFLVSGESLSAGCSILSGREGVSLAHCP